MRKARRSVVANRQFMHLVLLALCAAACPIVHHASAQTWEIEVVEYGRYFAGIRPCLKLDEAGRPHMLQGAERVLYSWHDGTAWREEAVAQPPPCGRAEQASLTLDAEGQPHVAYGFSWTTAGGEQWHEELRYAYRDGTGWHVQTVGSQGNGGNWPSLALDSSGCPHISYIDYAAKTWYARRDAAGWYIEAVGSPGEEVGPAALSVDTAGNPHLSYVGGISMDVKYARRDASGWHMETVDSLDAWGGLPALTLDAAGNPHIGYGDRANQHLGYAFRDGSGWHLQAVDPQEYAALGISIALDGARYPHISYIGDNRDLRYVYADAGGWHTQTVYSEGEPAIFTSLALDGSGRPHIVFHHREFWIEGWYTADLRYAYMDAAGWRLQTVATAGWTSRYVSLAVDGAGHPHIGYNFVLRDESANRVRRWLRYAERDEAGWRLQTVFRDSVDSSMYHEEALSLVLDDGDRVHLAYISTTFNPTLLTPGLHDDLKYAHEASLGWDVHTVAGNAGSSCSIVLDGAGYPHISYYGDGVLTYAYGSAAGWHREVVTSDAYRDCSLALDSSGYPHISYCSGAYPDQDLRYTYRDAGGWHVQTVDSLGSVGTDCSLTLDRSDRPHISYYAAPGHDLKYAHEGQAGWCVEIVDSLGSVGRFTSLAMDGGDKAHIAYHDATNDDLKYAYQGPSGWNVLTVDAVGPAGGYCSLALDESGRAHIAYYASVDCIPVGDLRYARAEFISNGSELASWAGMIRLVSVAPNPFVTSTELRWEQGSPGLVEAAVFDLLGRKVAAVAEGEAEQGEKRLTWRPVGLQSGVYVLRVSVDGSTAAVQPLIYRR